MSFTIDNFSIKRFIKQYFSFFRVSDSLWERLILMWCYSYSCVPLCFNSKENPAATATETATGYSEIDDRQLQQMDSSSVQTTPSIEDDEWGITFFVLFFLFFFLNFICIFWIWFVYNRRYGVQVHHISELMDKLVCSVDESIEVWSIFVRLICVYKSSVDEVVNGCHGGEVV